ncbi:hypothetical protein GQ53DRAFT_830195 [Thozetella sp. PMI_491]|nr:hypothetical protein GQ53DRAFT_830195 [Thozetella sp. PMI_491]
MTGHHPYTNYNIQDWSGWKGPAATSEHIEHTKPKKKIPKIDLMTSLFMIPTSLKDLETKQWTRATSEQKKAGSDRTWADLKPLTRHRSKSSKLPCLDKRGRHKKNCIQIEVQESESQGEPGPDSEGENKYAFGSEDDLDSSFDSVVEIEIIRSQSKRGKQKDCSRSKLKKYDRRALSESQRSKAKLKGRSKESLSRKSALHASQLSPRGPKGPILGRRLPGAGKISAEERKTPPIEGYPPPITNPETMPQPSHESNYNTGQFGNGFLSPSSYQYSQMPQVYIQPPPQGPNFIPQSNQPSEVIYITPPTAGPFPPTMVPPPTPAFAPLPPDPGPTPAGLSFREHLVKLKAHYNKMHPEQDLKASRPAQVANTSPEIGSSSKLDGLASPSISPARNESSKSKGSPSHHSRHSRRRKSSTGNKKRRSSETHLTASTIRPICILCGSPRSERYVQDHPVKPGAAPRPSICRHCRRRAHKTDRPDSLPRVWDRLLEDPYMRFWCVRCGTVRSSSYHNDHPVGGRQPTIIICGRCEKIKCEDYENDFTIIGNAEETHRRHTDELGHSSRGGERHSRVKAASVTRSTKNSARKIVSNLATYPIYGEGEDPSPKQNNVGVTPRPRANTSRPRQTQPSATGSLPDSHESSSQLTKASLSTTVSYVSLRSDVTITPGSPLVHHGDPKDMSPVAGNGQPPLFESVTNSEVSNGGIGGHHPDPSHRLDPLKSRARRRREERNESGLHAITSDAQVHLPHIPQVPQVSLSNVGIVGQGSPNGAPTVKSNKSGSSSIKTPGSTTCSSGCQVCGCRGFCQKSTTSSSSRTHPRSCLRARGRATTESSSQKTVQWSESQSFSPAPEYDRTPDLPSPEEQMRRWEEITQDRRGSIPPRPLTPEEISRRFSSNSIPGPSAWVPPPNAATTPAPTSEYSTSGATPPPFQSAWEEPREPDYHPKDQSDQGRCGGSQSAGSARFHSASSTTHSSSQWKSSSSSSRAVRHPGSGLHESPDTTPATATFPDMPGGDHSFSFSQTDFPERFDNEQPIQTNNGSHYRPRSAGAWQSPSSRRGSREQAYYDGGASERDASDHVNFSYPTSSPRNSPRERPRHRSGTSRHSQGSGVSTATSLPEALIWEVDSNEAAEIQGTQIPGRDQEGNSHQIGENSRAEDTCVLFPTDRSLVCTATGRLSAGSAIASWSASSLEGPVVEDTRASSTPANTLPLESAPMASNNPSEDDGYYTASESSFSINSSRKAHTGHSTEGSG